MINAVILAENNDSRLKDYSPNKALLEINGKYMIEYAGSGRNRRDRKKLLWLDRGSLIILLKAN